MNPPSHEALALLRRTSLTRLLAEAIEDAILRGELPPGARLNEMALAQRYGTSRGPLREALRLLEEAGLVQQARNRGASVRVVPLAEAADLYDVRAGLDATAARLLAARLTAEQLHTLREMTEAMRTLPETAVDRFHELNLAFHEAIVVFTGNPVLVEHYRRVTKCLTLFRRRNLLAPRAIPRFAEEHAAIVDLLAEGDGPGAAEALFAHARGGRQRMLDDGELVRP